MSHFYYGFNDRHEGNFDDALKHLNLYIHYCSQVGDSMHMANGLYQVGTIESIRGNDDQSLSIYLRILNIYKNSNLKGAPYGVATALNSIGDIYLKTEKYDKAIDCFTSALQIEDSLENGKTTVSIAVNYAGLGEAYRRKKEYDKARKYYERALKMSRELGNDWGTANVLENLGYISTQSEKHQEALTYHLNSLAIRERLAQKRELAGGLSNVGYTYLKLKDYPAAHRYLLKSLALAREIQAKPLIYDIYKDLADLMAEKKDFSQAYEYHHLHATLKDSVLNEETTRQLQELQTKYETGEKDKRIAILAKEKQVQQKEAQWQALQKKALTGGLLLISVIALLMIYVQRQRMRNQKLLTIKNQDIQESNLKRQMSDLEMKALRAQINPHFIFNCMNSINRLILEGEAESASRYLTKFSKLIRLMLENSENASVSLQNELTMLESYIQLENLRFKGRIGYKITVDEAIDRENTYLPSMVLQPFVENAIWHGLMHKEKNAPGFIRIAIQETEDVLTCEIEDNGVGREKAIALKEKSLASSKSMGLQITRERLKLLSRKKIKDLIHITDLKDSLDQALGTRVDILIPLA